jgi:hypothetical protein
VYETFVVRRNRTAVVCEASTSPRSHHRHWHLDRQTINGSPSAADIPRAAPTAEHPTGTLLGSNLYNRASVGGLLAFEPIAKRRPLYQDGLFHSSVVFCGLTRI